MFGYFGYPDGLEESSTGGFQNLLGKSFVPCGLGVRKGRKGFLLGSSEVLVWGKRGWGGVLDGEMLAERKADG